MVGICAKIEKVPDYCVRDLPKYILTKYYIRSGTERPISERRSWRQS